MEETEVSTVQCSCPPTPSVGEVVGYSCGVMAVVGIVVFVTMMLSKWLAED